MVIIEKEKVFGINVTKSAHFSEPHDGAREEVKPGEKKSVVEGTHEKTMRRLSKK